MEAPGHTPNDGTAFKGNRLKRYDGAMRDYDSSSSSVSLSSEEEEEDDEDDDGDDSDDSDSSVDDTPRQRTPRAPASRLNKPLPTGTISATPRYVDNISMCTLCKPNV